ncbi:MAG: hypothetical protein ACE5PV_14475 [Candidatus Poribacteria bacterium]
MCCRRRYSAVYTIEASDKPRLRSNATQKLSALANQEIADIIATTLHQRDIQRAYQIFSARQQYCEEDLFELFITALAKRRGC